MDPKYIILICAGAVLVIALIVVAVLLRRHRRKGEGERAEEVKIIDGVRYTKNDVIATPAGQANITLRPGDFLLEQGKSVTAEQGGRFLPGKYTVLATGEQTQVFNCALAATCANTNTETPSSSATAKRSAPFRARSSFAET